VKRGFFLEEGKIFVVARVIAVFGRNWMATLRFGQGGIGFAGKAIERARA